MSRISACIICYNEERKIEDCLKSLNAVVDEIVIVDSMSTDSTLEIAAKYTDKIIRQSFLGHGRQKNLAVGNARHDWILSLDCDERLSVRLADSILEIKGNLDRYDAYQMNRKTYYVYRFLNHCWYPDRKVRLFNRRKARWDDVAIHEKVVVDSSKIGLLQGDILHYSFDSISSHIQTIDRFTEISAAEIISGNKKITPFTPLGRALWTFVRMYILQRGFLDGFAGWVASALSFVHVFVKYSKVISHYRIRRTDPEAKHQAS